MTLQKGEEQVLKYTYDFAVLGGAVSAITLTAPVVPLEEGMIVRGVSVYTETALTSGGTPTLTLGNTGDVDGYMADIWAAANPVNSVVSEGEVAGALLWDDTNDHRLEYYIDSTANNQNLIMTVGTAALTAGKLSVHVRVYKPYSV
jgi:hypothetical protein